jgi:hypothetical protein
MHPAERIPESVCHFQIGSVVRFDCAEVTGRSRLPRAGRGCHSGPAKWMPARRARRSNTVGSSYVFHAPSSFPAARSIGLAICSARQLYCRNAGYADRANDAPVALRMSSARVPRQGPGARGQGRAREQSLSRCLTSNQQMPDLDRALCTAAAWSTGRCHLPRGRTGPPCRGHGFPRSHGPPEQDVRREWLTCHYRWSRPP